MKVYHELKPIYDKQSKILILGTMPSIKSRELGFYYMHPTNRFWKVISDILNEEYPNTIDNKKDFLNKNKIALWDVLESCDIKKSSDSSIKNIKVNNLNIIIKNSNIKYVFTTGKKAYQLYQKYCYNLTKIEAISLPSSSAANCTMTYEELKNKYSIIKTYLDK